MSLRAQLDAESRARKIFLDYFVYTATWNTLGAGATTPATTPITADSDFVLDAVSLVAYSGAGVLVVAPDYLIQLVDVGSGRNLQDNPIHVNNVTGQGNLLYVLPEPKLFKGSGAIQATLQNLTAVAARVDIAYIGRKVFYLGNYNRELVFGNF